jgi:CRP/FNR family transcriptional regulator
MIDAKMLEQVLMDNSKFAMMMFQVASEMFKKSVMNFISLAHKQKEGRIADIFLYLAAEVYCSNTFVLSLTRKEIAEFAGCSTENVIMTLSKWQNEKVVTLDGKSFCINDLDKLKYISKIG